jgi:Glycosyl transferase family 2
MFSIIISAHNEENNISHLLVDISKEIKKTYEKKEILLGLSGCSDDTEKIAKKAIKDLNLKAKIFHTPIGKVNSQIFCLKKMNKNSWATIFLDCDIKIKQGSILKLIDEARKYETVKLFYSKETPFKRKSIFYNIINVRTINPKYIIAKKNVTIFHPHSKNKRQKVFFTGGMYLLKKGIYDLDKNVLGDDTYLTHSIYHRFGFGTIKQTKSSIIFYQPVYTFSSWIKKWKRIWGDLNNLYLKHPEFKYLEEYMDLKVDFKKLLLELRLKLMIYFILERSWNKWGKIFLRKSLNSNKTSWEQLGETKKLE